MVPASSALFAVQVDRLVVSGLADQRDHALRLAERIGTDEMRAVGKQRDGTQELCYLGLGVAVTKDRQPEGCLGNKYVTADKFERDAGRIHDILVIARGHDSQTLCLDGDLRRTKHVPRGVECHPCAPERNGLAVADRLRRGGEVRAIA
jgi:hypothetical protein